MLAELLSEDARRAGRSRTDLVIAVATPQGRSPWCARKALELVHGALLEHASNPAVLRPCCRTVNALVSAAAPSLGARALDTLNKALQRLMAEQGARDPWLRAYCARALQRTQVALQYLQMMSR